MKRPVLWTLFFMISGILAGRYTSFDVWLFLLTAIFLCFSCVLYKIWKSKTPFIFFLFFIVGVFSIYHQLTPKSSILENIAQQREEIVVEGTIVQTGKTNNNNPKLKVKCNKISSFQGNVTDKIYLLVYAGQIKEYKVGQKIYCKGELNRLEPKTTPGTYDEYLILKTQGYDYKIYSSSEKVLGEDSSFFLKNMIRWKEKIKVIYDTILPPEESAIIKAMVTGDKEDIDFITKELYTQAGITHILAISGLHISIVSMSVYLFIRRMLRQNRRRSSVSAIAVLLFFVVFTGASPSAVRATIMVLIGFLGNLFYRSGDSFNNIGIAAMVLLFLNPLYLWNIGFQLSFATVSGILLGLEWLEGLEDVPLFVKNMIGLPLFATISSFPITIFYFHWISLVGILSNVVVLPLLSVVLILSIVIGILGFITIKLAVFIGGTVYYILQLYEIICSLVIKIPFSYIHVGKISLITVLFFYMLFLWIHLYRKEVVWWKQGFCILLVCFFFSITGNKLLLHRQKIAFLDVGQGDSIAITTYDGKAFVIDGGGHYYQSFGRNTGKSIVMPYLESQGIREIEGIFLTHMDRDHGEGVLELMEYMPVKRVFISDYPFEESSFYISFLKSVKRNKIPIFIVKAGDTTNIGNEMELTCLYPTGDGSYQNNDDNHGSMVLKLEYEDVSFLFTGDAGCEDEKVMIDSGMELDCTILKAGHHGSKYSTSKTFLKKTTPEIAIISAGKNNVYGHPHEETIHRLKEQEVKIIETAKDGSIIIDTNGKGYRIKTMMEGY